MREVRYRIWFEAESSARLRYFTDRDDACAWASANQPNRPYKVCEERQGPTRQIVRRLRRSPVHH